MTPSKSLNEVLEEIEEDKFQSQNDKEVPK